MELTRHRSLFLGKGDMEHLGKLAAEGVLRGAEGAVAISGDDTVPPGRLDEGVEGATGRNV